MAVPELNVCCTWTAQVRRGILGMGRVVFGTTTLGLKGPCSTSELTPQSEPGVLALTLQEEFDHCSLT
jgi:hypothetical protein